LASKVLAASSPETISDGKAGFLIRDNSPECIKGALALVEENFTFERAVERWKEVLDEI
jgi:hypothetical protein